jgi:hypothetical protein
MDTSKTATHGVSNRLLPTGELRRAGRKQPLLKHPPQRSPPGKVADQRRSPHTGFMLARAGRAVLMIALALVVSVACTAGPGVITSSSTPGDLQPASVPASPSSTTAVVVSAPTTSPPANTIVRTETFSSPKAAAATSATPSNDQARLTRPLHLPVLHPGQACPVSPETPTHSSVFTGPALGVGPVHPLADGNETLISPTNQAGWLAIKSLWVSDPTYQGPFLVRIRRLDGSGPAGVLEDPTVTSFFVPDGPTWNSEPGGYRAITGATWVKTPGCVAWQVDGLTFSHVIVIHLRCPPPDCTLPPVPATARTGQSTAPKSR